MSTIVADGFPDRLSETIHTTPDYTQLKLVSDDMPVLLPGVPMGLANSKPWWDVLDAAAIYAFAKGSTVEVKTEVGKGSGFLLDDKGDVATAAHVVLGTKELWVDTPDGKEYRATIVKLNDIDDVAELKLQGYKTNQHQPLLELGSSAGLKKDDPIYALGFPRFENKLWISPGKYSSKQPHLDFMDMILIDRAVTRGVMDLPGSNVGDLGKVLLKDALNTSIHVEPGNSGGPLLNSSGQVIGIAHMARAGTAGYFVPVEDLKDLLHSNYNQFHFQYKKVRQPLSKGAASLGWGFAAGDLVCGVGTVTRTNFKELMATGRIESFAKDSMALTSGLFGLELLGKDCYSWWKSTYGVDQWKYGLSALCDTAMVAGSIAALVPSARTAGFVTLASAAAARFGTDFIPDRLVLEKVTREESQSRPPFDWVKTFN